MNAVMRTWQDGPYIFIVHIDFLSSKEVNVKVKGTTSDGLPKVTASSGSQGPLFTSESCMVVCSRMFTINI